MCVSARTYVRVCVCAWGGGGVAHARVGEYRLQNHPETKKPEIRYVGVEVERDRERGKGGGGGAWTRTCHTRVFFFFLKTWHCRDSNVCK